MVGLREVQAALNAPGLVTNQPLSFNQLKIELAKKLHIQADDEVFSEHKQAIKDSYVKVFNEVCKPLAAAPAPAKKTAPPPKKAPAPAKKPAAKKRQDSESEEEEESDGSESASESEESDRGGRKGSAFSSDPEVRRLMGIAKKCGVSLAKATAGASSAREMASRITSTLNKAGLKNTDEPTSKELKKVLAKQEALADLDGIDPSNIVEASGRPRRAAAAKVDYRAVLKIEGLDSEDSDDGSDAGSESSSGSGSFSGSGDESDGSESGNKRSSKDKKEKHSSKDDQRSRHSGEEKRRPKIKANSSDHGSASEDEASAAPAPAAPPAEAQKRRRVIESDED